MDLILTPSGNRRCRTLLLAVALTVCAVLLVLLSSGPASSRTEGGGPERVRLVPERRVEDNRLISENDPAMEVRITDEAAYLGARRIVIDDRFDAEIHVFAEADPFGLIERFYWVQFEQYLPDAPGRYDYAQSNPDTVRIDDVEMHVRPGGENTTESVVRPGSDYEAFRELVDGAGYRLPTWLSTLRLVHLYEPSERGELIVFYGEGPDALAEAAQRAVLAGQSELVFADMLRDLIADVDARVDMIPRDPGEAAD